MSDLVVRPPWQLRGDGYVIFYRFERDFALQWTPPELHDRFRGGTGAVAFVNYKDSPVGGYGELLFIPGRFDDGKKARFSITRIFVSTYSSVMSGRANWGIPKERASFNVGIDDEGLETLTTEAINGDPIAQFNVRPGLLKMPLPNNRLFPLQIVQWWEGQQFNTKFWGGGRLGLMDVEGLHINGDLFPDVSGQTPIGAVKVWGFRLTFGVPKIQS
ncbi:MAG: acetoacetate decarboxylase family protein [Chloroflexi bacterium]|nr:acetoacetate decarboxylase family protein [Chloroflexota bacterium]